MPSSAQLPPVLDLPFQRKGRPVGKYARSGKDPDEKNDQKRSDSKSEKGKEAFLQITADEVMQAWVGNRGRDGDVAETGIGEDPAHMQADRKPERGGGDPGVTEDESDCGERNELKKDGFKVLEA